MNALPGCLLRLLKPEQYTNPLWGKCRAHPPGSPAKSSEAVSLGRGRRNSRIWSFRRKAETEWSGFLLTKGKHSPRLYAERILGRCPVPQPPAKGRKEEGRMPREKRKTEIVTMRMTPHTKELLQEKAKEGQKPDDREEQQGMNMS